MEVAVATTTMVQTEEPFDEVGLKESLGEMKATPTIGIVNIGVTPVLLQTLLGLQQPGIQSAVLNCPQMPVQSATLMPVYNPLCEPGQRQSTLGAFRQVTKLVSSAKSKNRLPAPTPTMDILVELLGETVAISPPPPPQEVEVGTQEGQNGTLAKNIKRWNPKVCYWCLTTLLTWLETRMASAIE